MTLYFFQRLQLLLALLTRYFILEVCLTLYSFTCAAHNSCYFRSQIIQCFISLLSHMSNILPLFNELTFQQCCARVYSKGVNPMTNNTDFHVLSWVTSMKHNQHNKHLFHQCTCKDIVLWHSTSTANKFQVNISGQVLIKFIWKSIPNQALKYSGLLSLKL